jgi:molybdopterin synthase catalytic subunit
MIKARLFARLREQADTSCELVELPVGTVADVYRQLLSRHPAMERDTTLIRAARNEEFVSWDDAVHDGDEVAFIPPVSGGAEALGLMALTTAPLDPRRTEDAVSHPGAGAIVTFTGIVRDNNRGETVAHLEYEAYEGMAEREFRRIGEEIADRWPGTRVAIVHRTGRLEIGEASVVISVSSARRAAAFDGCRHAIEQIKESVPIWKKEFAASGEVWIEGPTARSTTDRSDG